MSDTSTAGRLVFSVPAESFFSILQREFFDRHRWNKRRQARQDITTWIHSWYNQRWLHSAIGMIPLIEYKQPNTPDPLKQPLHDWGEAQ